MDAETLRAALAMAQRDGNAQAVAELQQMLDAQSPAQNTTQATQPPPETGSAEALAAGVGQGATFGFGDELYGALASLTSGANDVVQSKIFDFMNPEYAGQYGKVRDEVPMTYERARDTARGINEQARGTNPWAYYTGEIGAGLTQGVLGGAKTIAGQTFRQAIPRLGGVGAAMGGASGMGYSEADTVGGVLGDTAAGAAGGGALGVALPALGQGAHYMSSGSRAARVLQQDLLDAGLTPEQATQMLQRNPNMVVADLAENLQQRLGGLAQAPGQTPQAARIALRARTEGQLPRFEKTFTEMLGNTPVSEAATAAKARTRALAGPLYERAYEIPISPQAQPKLRALLNRDPGAIRSAQQTLTRRGEAIDLDGPLNVRTVDKITSYLGGRERALRASGDVYEADSFKTLRKNILDVLDVEVPVLRQARTIARDEFADNDAIEIGKRAFNLTKDDLNVALREMSESEMEHFRVGVFDKVMDLISRKSDTADIAKQFSNPKARYVLERAFGSPENYSRFMSQLGDEQIMYETMQKAMYGSPTASRLAFGVEPANPPMSLFDATSRGVKKAANFVMKRPNENARDLLGQGLMSRDPQQMLQLMTQQQPMLPSLSARPVLPR